MAGDRTTVTELVTGLGTLGFDDVGAALAARPAEMVSLSPEQWDLLEELHRGGAYRQEFVAAWQNGVAFLAAAEGLRGRRPLTVEWRGGQRQPGDEPVPADLRIDHVFLVSCKYLSKILTNPSPSTLFDRLLAGGHGARSTDWYAEVAPDAYQALYEAVVEHCQAQADQQHRAGGAAGLRPALPDAARGQLDGIAEPIETGNQLDGIAEPVETGGRLEGIAEPVDAGSTFGRRASLPFDDLPRSVHELVPRHREALKQLLAGKGRWPAPLRPAATAFSTAVAQASAARWRQALANADPERVLWRLLRIGSAPYFVLGAGPHGPLRLRIATAWDWRQHFRIVDFVVACGVAREQPVVEWKVEVARRRGAERSTIEGHVEIRWSHGKFAQPPEAKVYLDTPHHQVPGYWSLT